MPGQEVEQSQSSMPVSLVTQSRGSGKQQATPFRILQNQATANKEEHQKTQTQTPLPVAADEEEKDGVGKL
jgi:hypothetical protein